MAPCLILTVILVMVPPARIPNCPSGWNESTVLLETWSTKGTGEPEGSCTHWAFKLTWEQSWTSWCALTLRSWSKSHEYIFHSASWRSNLLWLFEYDQITSGSQVLQSFSLNFNLDKVQQWFGPSYKWSWLWRFLFFFLEGIGMKKATEVPGKAPPIARDIDCAFQQMQKHEYPVISKTQHVLTLKCFTWILAFCP